MTDSPSSDDWLSRRTPPPPDELASAIRAALKSRTDDNKDPSPTELLEAAQALLEKVLKDECAQRKSALDLLTADALVTYALEIASEKAVSLRDFPEYAMDHLAGKEK
jgi:hypothetical protein